MHQIRPFTRALVWAPFLAACCGQATAAGMQAGGAPGDLRSPDGIPIIQVYEDPARPPGKQAVPQSWQAAKPPTYGGWSEPPGAVPSGPRRSGGSGLGMGSGGPRGDTPRWGPSAAATGPSWMGEPGQPGGYDAAGGYPPPPGPSLEYVTPQAPAADAQFPDAQTWITEPAAPAPQTQDLEPSPMTMPDFGAFQFPPRQLDVGQDQPPSQEQAGSEPPGAESDFGPPAGWPGFGPGGRPGFPPGGTPWGFGPRGGYGGMPPMWQPPAGAEGELSPIEQRLKHIEELLEQLVETQQRLQPK